MTLSLALQTLCLGGVVLSCWLGCLGMLRMRTPTEALHFLSLPTCVAAPLLTLAIGLRSGFSSATFKTAAITVVLLLINGIVVHATARAFRTRELGHWQPRPEDPITRAPRQEPS